MPLPFTCPHCGLETLVDDEFAGQAGPCAGCGKSVRVPPFAGQSAPNAGSARPRKAHTPSVILLVCAAVVAGLFTFSVLAWLVFPAAQGIVGSVQSLSCRGNLERIATALRLYESEHGSLPPAYVLGPDGKPWHSWRVLILPQLNERGLHQRYRFDEPWNGPNNSQLVNAMPECFACPSDPDARTKGESSYMVIVGPGTLFPGTTSQSTGKISDDVSLTILVAESPVSGVVWTQPKDLDATRMKFSVNGAMSGEVASLHPRGANVVMADGHAKFLSDLLPDAYLKGLTTTSGREDIPPESLEP